MIIRVDRRKCAQVLPALRRRRAQREANIDRVARAPNRAHMAEATTLMKMSPLCPKIYCQSCSTHAVGLLHAAHSMAGSWPGFIEVKIPNSGIEPAMGDISSSPSRLPLA